MSATERPLRVDAERNRRRIVDAAREVFRCEGFDAGVEAVAREAGVGIGTLYRRFPTKGELVVAILHDLTEATLERIAAIDESDPWEALATALQTFGEQVAGNRSLYDALFTELAGAHDMLADLKARLLDAFEPRLRAAQAAGLAREDVEVTDLIPLVSGAARVTRLKPTAEPAFYERYLAIAIDGLRTQGASPLPGSPLPRVVE